MGRIRTVKPDLFRHEELFEAEHATRLPLRLAFIGLTTCADIDGRFRWRPRVLKLDVLPYDAVDFDAVMNALAEHGFIRRYEVDGEAFGCFPTWAEHQRPNHRESASRIPPPPDVGTTFAGPTFEHPPGHAREIPGHVPGEREGEREREEGKSSTNTNTVGRSIAINLNPAPVASVTPLAQAVEFPVKGGGVWRPSQEDLHRWRNAYPRLNRLEEFRKARVWLGDNPNRLKTKRGMTRFIGSWLARAASAMPASADVMF